MPTILSLAQLRQALRHKPAAEECFPFRPDVPVYKVAGKIFAICFEKNHQAFINLKCEPNYAEQLRSLFRGVQPGYHMAKKHWNSVQLNGDLPNSEIYCLIDHSYRLVVQSLPKHTRQNLALQFAELSFLTNSVTT